jgi:peroxiredoxin
MPLPEVGSTVPDFTLNTLDGESYQLATLTARGATLLVFFKQSCVTSKLALPFIERLHKNYPTLQLLGVSQDNADETQTTLKEWGITFPVVLDPQWKVSLEYDLFTVPTTFMLHDDKVTRVNLGWNKGHYEALSQELAQLLSVAPVPLFTAADAKVPAFKPG